MCAESIRFWLPIGVHLGGPPSGEGAVEGTGQPSGVSTQDSEPGLIMFSSGRGTPLDKSNLMRRIIKPAAKLLGMPWLSWRVLRHTHATLGEQIGIALSDRQAQMGHGDVQMTMH